MAPLVAFELDYLTEFGSGGARRPYLWLQVTGPEGNSLPIRGLIDTGADRSSLPAEYAALLRLDPSDVAIETGQQVSGTFSVWTWPTTLQAFVIGQPEYAFEIHPTFTPGSLTGLWGRSDFLRLWNFVLDEGNQRLYLSSKVEA